MPSFGIDTVTSCEPNSSISRINGSPAGAVISDCSNRPWLIFSVRNSAVLPSPAEPKRAESEMIAAAGKRRTSRLGANQLSAASTMAAAAVAYFDDIVVSDHDPNLTSRPPACTRYRVDAERAGAGEVKGSGDRRIAGRVTD